MVHPCDVCGSEGFRVESYVLDGWCLEEEATQCSTCGYYSLFSYGFFVEGFTRPTALMFKHLLGKGMVSHRKRKWRLGSWWRLAGLG